MKRQPGPPERRNAAAWGRIFSFSEWEQEAALKAATLDQENHENSSRRCIFPAFVKASVNLVAAGELE